MGSTFYVTDRGEAVIKGEILFWGAGGLGEVKNM